MESQPMPVEALHLRSREPCVSLPRLLRGRRRWLFIVSTGDFCFAIHGRGLL